MSCMQRRVLLRAAAAGALGPCLSLVSAQSYPAKPIRLVVPFAPGGSTDVLARFVAKLLSERLNQNMLVENKPGAGGNIGADIVAKAAPDGYSLVMGSIGTHATNGLIYPKMPYEALRDFAPVELVATVTLVLVVHPSIQAQTTAELIALLKKRPGEFSYASGGFGSSQHLAAELFKYLTHTSMLHVPYKGSAGALTDLLTGRVPIMFADLPLVAAHIASGSLRPLGVGDAQPIPALPTVPALAQSGVPGYFADAWYGVFAPAATPAPIVARLQSELTAILKLPDVRRTMADQGAMPSGLAGADLRRFQEGEIKRWGEVVRAADIKMD